LNLQGRENRQGPLSGQAGARGNFFPKLLWFFSGNFSGGPGGAQNKKKKTVPFFAGAEPDEAFLWGGPGPICFFYRFKKKQNVRGRKVHVTQKVWGRGPPGKKKTPPAGGGDWILIPGGARGGAKTFPGLKKNVMGGAAFRGAGGLGFPQLDFPVGRAHQLFGGGRRGGRGAGPGAWPTAPRPPPQQGGPRGKRPKKRATKKVTFFAEFFKSDPRGALRLPHVSWTPPPIPPPRQHPQITLLPTPHTAHSLSPNTCLPSLLPNYSIPQSSPFIRTCLSHFSLPCPTLLPSFTLLITEPTHASGKRPLRAIPLFELFAIVPLSPPTRMVPNTASRGAPSFLPFFRFGFFFKGKAWWGGAEKKKFRFGGPGGGDRREGTDTQKRVDGGGQPKGRKSRLPSRGLGSRKGKKKSFAMAFLF